MTMTMTRSLLNVMMVMLMMLYRMIKMMMALMMMSGYGTNLLSHHTPSAPQLF